LFICRIKAENDAKSVFTQKSAVIQCILLYICVHEAWRKISAWSS